MCYLHKKKLAEKKECVSAVYNLMSSLQGEIFFSPLFLIMPRKKYCRTLIKHHVNTVTRYPVLEE
jgi:hypothetical protein